MCGAAKSGGGFTSSQGCFLVLALSFIENGSEDNLHRTLEQARWELRPVDSRSCQDPCSTTHAVMSGGSVSQHVRLQLLFIGFERCDQKRFSK